MRIKNKSNKFSEGDALIAPAFENNALNNSIPNSTQKVKQKQFDIIQATNPMWDDYHTGIRSVDEIFALGKQGKIIRNEKSPECSGLLVYLLSNFARRLLISTRNCSVSTFCLFSRFESR